MCHKRATHSVSVVNLMSKRDILLKKKMKQKKNIIQSKIVNA